MTTAASFLQFCKGPSAECMRLTWAELDALHDAPKPTYIQLPDLAEADYRDALMGHPTAFRQFPDACHEFINQCYSQIKLHGMTEADIDKALTVKPTLSTDEIKAKLPEWLRDKVVGFLPRLANELPPRRAWDHKIELIPGKEPPY